MQSVSGRPSRGRCVDSFIASLGCGAQSVNLCSSHCSEGSSVVHAVRDYLLSGQSVTGICWPFMGVLSVISVE